jgi:hypothetical protein
MGSVNISVPLKAATRLVSEDAADVRLAARIDYLLLSQRLCWASSNDPASITLEKPGTVLNWIVLPLMLGAPGELPCWLPGLPNFLSRKCEVQIEFMNRAQAPHPLTCV